MSLPYGNTSLPYHNTSLPYHDRSLLYRNTSLLYHDTNQPCRDTSLPIMVQPSLIKRCLLLQYSALCHHTSTCYDMAFPYHDTAHPCHGMALVYCSVALLFYDTTCPIAGQPCLS